jgi:hypothetical protein
MTVFARVTFVQKLEKSPLPWRINCYDVDIYGITVAADCGECGELISGGCCQRRNLPKRLRKVDSGMPNSSAAFDLFHLLRFNAASKFAFSASSGEVADNPLTIILRVSIKLATL